MQLTDNAAIRQEFEALSGKLQEIYTEAQRVAEQIRHLQKECPHSTVVFGRDQSSFLHCPDCGEFLINPLNPPDMFG